MDVDEETARKRVKAQWQVLALIGIGLALWGSYIAINAAFDDDTFCAGAGFRCVTIDDTDEIWMGLVMTVIGVAAALKARRELTPDQS